MLLSSVISAGVTVAGALPAAQQLRGEADRGSHLWGSQAIHHKIVEGRESEPALLGIVGDERVQVGAVAGSQAQTLEPVLAFVMALLGFAGEQHW